MKNSLALDISIKDLLEHNPGNVGKMRVGAVGMTDYLEWSDVYSVGVRELDDQHKNMLALSNDLIHAADTKKKREVIGEIIDVFLNNAREHFLREEEMLEEAGYPGLDEHRREHANLIQTVLEFIDLFNERTRGSFYSDTTVDGGCFAMFLIGWILLHIKKEDQKYTSHLNSRGIY